MLPLESHATSQSLCDRKSQYSSSSSNLDLQDIKQLTRKQVARLSANKQNKKETNKFTKVSASNMITPSHKYVNSVLENSKKMSESKLKAKFSIFELKHMNEFGFTDYVDEYQAGAGDAILSNQGTSLLQKSLSTSQIKSVKNQAQVPDFQSLTQPFSSKSLSQSVARIRSGHQYFCAQKPGSNGAPAQPMVRVGKYGTHKNVMNQINKIFRPEYKGLSDLKRMGVASAEKQEDLLRKLCVIQEDKNKYLKQNVNYDYVYDQMIRQNLLVDYQGQVHQQNKERMAQTLNCLQNSGTGNLFSCTSSNRYKSEDMFKVTVGSLRRVRNYPKLAKKGNIVTQIFKQDTAQITKNVLDNREVVLNELDQPIRI